MFSGKEYIYEVNKEKSFSKAAKKLYISQPSLSTSIKRIEQKIGCPIFDRGSHPIELTDCGRKYLQAAEEIMEIERNFTQYLSDLQQLKTGTLSVGGSNLYSSYVLPPLITKYTKAYPQITIHLLEDNSAQLRNQLLAGDVDIIIDNISYDDTIFEKYSYKPEHLILAVPKHLSVNDKLQKYQLPSDSMMSGDFLKDSYSPVPMESFSQESFIMLKQENDTYTKGMELCRLAGFAPRILMQLDQQVTAYNITCSGMGICFVGDTLIRSTYPHPNINYYKLPAAQSSRNTYFYLKANRYVTYAISEFLKLIQSEVSNRH